MIDTDYVGPCEIDCPEKCAVPAGATLSEVPRPRHAWDGMVHCPNCPKSFLVVAKGVGRPEVPPGAADAS